MIKEEWKADGEEAQRFNEGKLQYSLVPPEFLRELADITSFGAVKYSAENWKKGMPESKMVDSLMRHLQAHRLGEYADSESGCSHLGHVAWNALALMWFHENGKV